jgi:ribosome-binding ATPase YchF (GTP1/OBG family)
LIVANTSEDKFADFDSAAFAAKVNAPEGVPIVPICAQIEAELAELSDEEAHEFLESIGAKNSGLENLIQACFKLLGLQSYFTAGVTEVRAWTIKVGATAPQAAGEIHTDFEKGFIKADVIAYDDFMAAGSEALAKEKGKMRLEGKTYIVKDGDVMHFKFNN